VLVSEEALRTAVAGQTPAYVYDLGEVRRAWSLLHSALPQPSQLLYSLKANPHPAIVRPLAQLGCSAEVCSPGELATALEVGLPPDRILYTGPGKRDTDVELAVRAGVRWFSVDSLTGLGQVRRIAAGAPVRCLLRINDQVPVPGQGLAMTGVSSQFGIDASQVAADPAAFRAGIAGFHLYLGSNLSDETTLLAQFGAAIATAKRLTGVLSLELELVNLGGGFGAPFARPGDLPRFGALAARLATLLDESFPAWRQGRPIVVFESGRYLSGTCGSLFTRVLDVKRSHGRPVVVLESGINHLGGMSGLRRLPPIVPELISAGGNGQALLQAIVAGPLCTPLDTWARAADIPAVQPGDIVRVPNVGAYGLSASLLAFLGHPLPLEVVVDGGEIIEVSQLALVRQVMRAHGPKERSAA
jgi:diaminopimelate decarboxylase